MRLSSFHGPAFSTPSLLRTISKSSIKSFDYSQQFKGPWICQRCLGQRTLHSKNNLRPSVQTLTFSRTDNKPRTVLYSQKTQLLDESEHGSTKQRSELPSQEEHRRSHLSKRFSNVMDHLQSNIFIAGQRLNDLTGYSGIEVLKKEIEIQGHLGHKYTVDIFKC